MRAADDFEVIRARMVELQHERESEATPPVPADRARRSQNIPIEMKGKSSTVPR